MYAASKIHVFTAMMKSLGALDLLQNQKGAIAMQVSSILVRSSRCSQKNNQCVYKSVGRNNSKISRNSSSSSVSRQQCTIAMLPGKGSGMISGLGLCGGRVVKL